MQAPLGGQKVRFWQVTWTSFCRVWKQHSRSLFEIAVWTCTFQGLLTTVFPSASRWKVQPKHSCKAHPLGNGFRYTSLKRHNSRHAINHHGSLHRCNNPGQPFHKWYVSATKSDHQIPSKIQCIHICLTLLRFHPTPKIVSIFSLYLPWHFQLTDFLLRPSSSVAPLRPGSNRRHCSCRCSNLRQSSHDSTAVPPTNDLLLEPF